MIQVILRIPHIGRSEIHQGTGGRCLKIRDVCMDFEPHFKVHNPGGGRDSHMEQMGMLVGNFEF